MLFGNDYKIETADGYKEALDIIEELLEEEIELPLVICDYIMPGMKGDELLKHIHAITPNTLKILLTGQADADAVGNAVNRANLYRYISKPWKPTDFNFTIREALGNYFKYKKLVQFYLGLEQEVAEHNRVMQDKNEFLSVVVHDLKTPLSAIMGFAEMIRSDFDEMPKEVIEVRLQI